MSRAGQEVAAIWLARADWHDKQAKPETNTITGAKFHNKCAAHYRGMAAAFNKGGKRDD